MLDLLIRGGKVLGPDGQWDALDVGIRDGCIVALERELTGPAQHVLDAEGMLLLPGIIDLHTHLRSPAGEEDLFVKETALAVAGGITTIGDFAYPPGTHFELDFSTKRQRLADQALCDFILHTVVRCPEDLDQVQTRTVKIFFSASGLGAPAEQALALLQQALARGHQVLVHVETLSDWAMILQKLSGISGGSLHILHVPHQRFICLARAWSDERVTLETCPHYLLWEWLQGNELANVNPPIVPADLWPEVRDGHLHTIGTDHCSYTLNEKKTLGFPGFPGLETLLPLMVSFGVLSGRLTWRDLSRVLSSGPARVLGLYPRKGVICVGSDADLVFFDPAPVFQVEKPAYGRADFTPYGGLWVRGRVVRTLVRGREVFSFGEADLAAAGWGKWQEHG